MTLEGEEEPSTSKKEASEGFPNLWGLKKAIKKNVYKARGRGRPSRILRGTVKQYIQPPAQLFFFDSVTCAFKYSPERAYCDRMGVVEGFELYAYCEEDNPDLNPFRFKGLEPGEIPLGSEDYNVLSTLYCCETFKEFITCTGKKFELFPLECIKAEFVTAATCRNFFVWALLYRNTLIDNPAPWTLEEAYGDFVKFTGYDFVGYY